MSRNLYPSIDFLPSQNLEMYGVYPYLANMSVLKYCSGPLFRSVRPSLLPFSAQKVAFYADAMQGHVLTLLRWIQTEEKVDYL